LTLALGVARLREHSLRAQRDLVACLARHGIAAEGGSEDRGAFVVVRDERAVALAQGLAAHGVVVDARGPWLRLTPDILTTGEEMARAAAALAAVRGAR
jgi:kynureninase